jgi:hypothetical protein
MKFLATVLSLFVLAVGSLHAQDCEVKQDPFTNEKTVSYNFKYQALYYELKSGIIKMEMKFHYPGELNVVIPKGTELSYKFDNGEILKLTTVVDANPQTKVASGTNGVAVYTEYSYVFHLTNEELKKLASNLVTYIRFPDTKGAYTDQKMDKKFPKIIREGAQCILKNL